MNCLSIILLNNINFLNGWRAVWSTEAVGRGLEAVGPGDEIAGVLHRVEVRQGMLGDEMLELVRHDHAWPLRRS